MSKQTESVPPSRGGEVRAEQSPAPTVASAGLSRPSTQATVRDGILLRWNSENNSMLRRPRTASSEGQLSNRSSAKINKARMNIVLRKQKVTGMVKALATSAAAANPVVQEKSAAELNYEAAKDVNQPYRFDKKQLLRQFRLRNGVNVHEMDLPVLPAERKPQSRVGDPYKTKNIAVRQMVNSYTSGAPIGLASPNYQPVSCLSPQSSHLCSRPYKASYLNRASRKSSARDEFKRLSELDNLMKEKVDQANSGPSQQSNTVETFFKGPRPQTTPSTSPTATTRRRPASCYPKLRFQEKKEDNPLTLTPASPSRPRRSMSAKSYRSCWMSPLEMCNIPADVKLKYIADEEKKRLAKIMSHTNRLLHSKQTPLHCNDKLYRELMAYKPQLDEEESEPITADELNAKAKEEMDNAFLELADFLESSKDEQLMQKLTKHLTTNVKSKRVVSQASDSHNDSRMSGSINPVLLGSRTTKAMLAGFYMLVTNHNTEEISI